MMKLFFLLAVVNLISCKRYKRNYSYVNIESINAKILNDAIDINVDNSKISDSSTYIILSFNVVYIDSVTKTITRTWKPKYGYNGLLDKIKSVNFYVDSAQITYHIFPVLIQGSPDFQLNKNKRIPKNIVESQFSSINDFIQNANEYRNKYINLYNLKTIELCFQFNKDSFRKSRKLQIDFEIGNSHLFKILPLGEYSPTGPGLQ